MSGSTNRPMTVPAFQARKGQGKPLVMLTAYDALTAHAAEAAGVDVLLVGDSLGNVLLGHASTVPVTLDDMVHHASAVGRVRKRALMVADLPSFTYHSGPHDAVRNAARLVQQSGADAVKLEGGRKRLEAIRAILDAEIPVMGHLGLTPQSVLAMGGYKVQGRESESAAELLEDAKALDAAGVFGIVLEGIPAALAEAITAAVSVPTIGIGAGSGCDGQVLVFHDLLGLSPGKPPKFVRQYAKLLEAQVEAIERWAKDVRERAFPGDDETYS